MSIKVWIQEFRAPFLIASVFPTLLGGTIAAATSPSGFNIPFFFLTMIGVVCFNIGANVTNDYFDYKSGADRFVTPEEKTPFSGGSGLLADGTIKPKKALSVGLLFLCSGCIIGLFFVISLGDAGLPVLIIGLIGATIAFFYTAPPFKFAYRGIGEVTLWVVFGPLVVIGTYYVQIRAFAWEPVIASIPMGLLITNILFINEFPDYRPDKKAGKNHIVVRLGMKKAIKGYLIIIVGIYISIIIGVMIGLLGITTSIPLWSLITLATIPLSVKYIRFAYKHYDEPQRLIPANAFTIQMFVLIALMMCFSYVPRFFGVTY